jgi:hypothetical protein
MDGFQWLMVMVFFLVVFDERNASYQMLSERVWAIHIVYGILTGL